MGERWAKKENYGKIVNIICKKTAKGMKPRNKTVEMEMQGREVSLPGTSHDKHQLQRVYQRCSGREIERFLRCRRLCWLQE